MMDSALATEARDVTCSACKRSIRGVAAVARCPSCGWQERRGSD